MQKVQAATVKAQKLAWVNAERERETKRQERETKRQEQEESGVVYGLALSLPRHAAH